MPFNMNIRENYRHLINVVFFLVGFANLNTTLLYFHYEQTMWVMAMYEPKMERYFT